MDVVVVGAGSLGSLVGGALARRHEVTLVGRDPHIEAIRSTGLRVEGPEPFVVHPRATTDDENLTADLAVVTTKAFDTPAVAATLSSSDVGSVCSLANGMGNEEVLSRSLDAPVIGGTTALGATLKSPGRVAWLGRGETVVGPWTENAADPARRVAEAFGESDLPTTVTDGIRLQLWEKLAANAAINPLTALAGVRNGAVLADPLGGTAAAAAREVAAAARSSGVALSPATAVETMARVARATADNRSSMAQDLAAGRRTEVEAINGHVVEQLGPDEAPVNATLAALVRASERDRGTGEV